MSHLQNAKIGDVVEFWTTDKKKYRGILKLIDRRDKWFDLQVGNQIGRFKYRGDSKAPWFVNPHTGVLPHLNEPFPPTPKFSPKFSKEQILDRFLK